MLHIKKVKIFTVSSFYVSSNLMAAERGKILEQCEGYCHGTTFC